MPKNLLRDMGLKDNEIQVYLSLLKEGPCNAMSVSKATGIERSLCYQVLNQLSHKGLVSSAVKDNRRYFKASKPDRLHDILKHKENEIAIMKDRLSAKLSELNNLSLNKKSSDFNVEVFIGAEGGKIVRMKVLNESKEYCVLGYHKFMKGFSPHWQDKWQKDRIKKKIKRRIIISPAFKDSKTARLPLTETRVLPYEYRDFHPTSTMIFGNDKVLISLPTEDEYYGILITSKSVYDSHKFYFNMLWKISEVL